MDVTQLNSTLQQSNKNMSLLIQTIQTLFPSVQGRFTMTAAATRTVPNTSIRANSRVFIQPVNAAAATLMASANSLYVSSIAPGASFTVATAGGGNAAGGEVFDYFAVVAI